MPDGISPTAISPSGGPSESLSMPLLPKNRIRIPFYRWFGPNAINAGYQKIVVDINPQSNEMSNMNVGTNAEQHRGDSGRSGPGPSSVLFNEFEHLVYEGASTIPRQEILDEPIRLFFSYYGGHFPFYHQKTLTERINARKCPSILINSICALSAKFAQPALLSGIPANKRGEIFAEKAKHLLIPLLNLPSYDVVASILFLAWNELANNHDVGIWMYTGMAVRMAEDLGMHTKSVYDSCVTEEERSLVCSLFWAIYILDHLICCATGRALTLDDSHIDIPHPANKSAFSSTITVMRVLGEFCKLDITAETFSVDDKRTLLQIFYDFITFLNGQDMSLQFNVDNYRLHLSQAAASSFLLFHIWANAVIIFLHRPVLRSVHEFNREETLLGPDSVTLSVSAARTISSILSVAAQIGDNSSFLGTPFIDQAVEVAGLVFIAEIGRGADQLLSEQYYQTCLQTMKKIKQYWTGLVWVTSTMECRYRDVVNSVGRVATGPMPPGLYATQLGGKIDEENLGVDICGTTYSRDSNIGVYGGGPDSLSTCTLPDDDFNSMVHWFENVEEDRAAWKGSGK